MAPSQPKIETQNLNFYYGSKLALKNLNIALP